jgi:hypothetical protein
VGIKAQAHRPARHLHRHSGHGVPQSSHAVQESDPREHQYGGDSRLAADLSHTRRQTLSPTMPYAATSSTCLTVLASASPGTTRNSPVCESEETGATTRIRHTFSRAGPAHITQSITIGNRVCPIGYPIRPHPQFHGVASTHSQRKALVAALPSQREVRSDDLRIPAFKLRRQSVSNFVLRQQEERRRRCASFLGSYRQLPRL